MQKNLKVVLPLALVIVIDTMGFGLILPVLGPLFMSPDSQMLGADVSTNMRTFLYGLTLAVFFLTAFFSSPILGSFSDQIGRKKVLAGCLSVIAISYVLCAIAIMIHSVTLLILGRALAGAAAGSQPIAQAAVIDISDAESKTANLSLISMCNSFGFVFGPLMAGISSNKELVSWFSYSTPFFLAGILAILNLISLAFTFKETYTVKPHEKISITKSLSALKFAFANKGIRTLSILFLLMSLAWAIYFQFISLFLNTQYHYGPMQIGWFMTVIAIVFGLSLAFIIRILLSIWTTRNVALIGLVLLTLGLAIVSIFDSLLAQWIGMLPVTLGLTISYMPLLTLFSDSVDEQSQGMIMGVTGSLGSATWAVTGFLISTLAAFGAQAPFIAAMLFGLLGVIFMLIFSNGRQQTK